MDFLIIPRVILKLLLLFIKKLFFFKIVYPASEFDYELTRPLTLKLDIEMGRLITGAQNPTVLYVSGGNTQVSPSQVSNALVPLNLKKK